MPLFILVADDNPGIRQAICDSLEFGGYSAVPASDGQEALEHVDTYHPHLIVADIKMPRLNGYEFIKKVRQRPEYRLIPVIFLTECNETQDRIQGYRVGCDAYLPKPFEMDELLAVVRNLLERSQIIQNEVRFARSDDGATPSPRAAAASKSESNTMARFNLDDLTEREQQVLELLAHGLSNSDIGIRLHLSPRTIEKYVSNLLRKTETNNRANLSRFAVEHHLIS